MTIYQTWYYTADYPSNRFIEGIYFSPVDQVDETVRLFAEDWAQGVDETVEQTADGYRITGTGGLDDPSERFVTRFVIGSPLQTSPHVRGKIMPSQRYLHLMDPQTVPSPRGAYRPDELFGGWRRLGADGTFEAELGRTAGVTMNTRSKVNLYRRLLRKAQADLRTSFFDDDYWGEEAHVTQWMDEAIFEYPDRYAGDPTQLVYDAVGTLGLAVDLNDDQHPIWDLAASIAGEEDEFPPEPAVRWDVVDSLRSRR